MGNRAATERGSQIPCERRFRLTDCLFPDLLQYASARKAIVYVFSMRVKNH